MTDLRLSFRSLKKAFQMPFFSLQRGLARLESEELRKRGIEIILVGGACVTIYSENRYESYDLDYVIYEDMRERSVSSCLKHLV